MESQNFSYYNGYQEPEEPSRSEFQPQEAMYPHSQSSNNDSDQIHGESQEEGYPSRNDQPNFNAHLALGSSLAPCDKQTVYAEMERLQYVEQMNFKEQPDKNHPSHLCFACSCCNRNIQGASLTQPKARRDSIKRPVRSKLPLCPTKKATTNSATSSVPATSTIIALFSRKAKSPSKQRFETKIKNIRFAPGKLVRIVFKSLDLKDKHASRREMKKKLKKFITEMQDQFVIFRGKPSKKANERVQKKINHFIDKVTSILYPQETRSEKPNRCLFFKILDAFLNTALNYLTFLGKYSFKLFCEMLSGREECYSLIRPGFKSLF